MPINLKYGQQAVERGFITPQRLQQVLAKQRQLAEQGKKVSVRMILEKAKLLSTVQLAQIDADLNIKVVKKQTGRFTASQPEAPPALPPSMKARTAPLGAQNFAGEAVPEFAGMTGANPDVTVFEPPPADMQDRIRNEREKAKALAKAKQEADAAQFFQQNDPNPFGDPFAASDEMAPEPFGGDMQPAAEMAPEPFAGEMQPAAEMEPAAQPMDDGGLAPMADEGMAELDRMDSSPKLSSIQAEFTGFASPDDEELPGLDSGFSAEPMPQARPLPSQRGAAPRAPAYAPPMQADLAPSGGEFDNFGNDIMSPDQLEAGVPAPAMGTKPLGSAPNVDRTMFSPPPSGIGGREKTGAMDRTVFSPRPEAFGGQPQAEAGPERGWDEPESAAGDMGVGSSEATVFSPPPEGVGRPSLPSKKPVGRQGAADFADIALPMGKRMDDIPTAPATGDDVHPLRRNVTTSQKGSQQMRPPSGPVPGLSDDLPSDEPSDMIELPETSPVMQPQSRAGKSSGRSAAAEPDDKGRFAPGKKRGKSDRADKAEREGRRGPPPGSLAASGKLKSKTPRVLMTFVFLVLVVIAVLVLPIYLTNIPQVKALRDNERAAPIYDYIEKKVIREITRLLGLGEKPEPAGKGAMPSNAPAGNEPASNTAPDNTQPPANGG